MNNLSIMMLGWKAQVTTEHTLTTYRDSNLYSCCDEFFIHFNQFTDEDRAMADAFGVRAIGSPVNLGIWGAMDAMAEAAKSKYLLFLQDDHPVVVSAEETKKWIDGAVSLLEKNKADIVLMCHRFNTGDHGSSGRFFKFFHVHELDPRVDPAERCLPGNYLKDTFARKLMRLFRPFAKWRHVYNIMFLEKHPEQVLPQYIWKDGDFYINDSYIRAFSETPYLISKRLYLELSAWAKKHPRQGTILGFQILEMCLNCRWWRRHHYRVALCDVGVFSHQRVDDSWREEHKAYNAEMVENGKCA